MDGDPLAPSDVSLDRVPGNGLAALGDLGQDTSLAFDPDLASRLELGHHRDERELAVAVRLAGRHILEQHRVGADVTVSDRGEEIVEVVEVKLLGQLEHASVANRRKRPLLNPAKLFVEELFTLGDILLSTFLLEPGADLLGGSGGLDETEPVTAGTMRPLGSEDLNDVTVLKRIVERHHPAVGLGPDAAVPDLGMDPVSEVDRGRTTRQGEYITLGGEDEDLVAKHVDLDRIHELLGVEHLFLPVHQLAEPGEALVHLALFFGALFVSPVRGHAPLRGLVHLVGSDLDLHRLPGVADDGGMQGLVAVRLRHGDVVLEATGDRLPERMDHAQGAVAVLDRVGQHPDRGEVVDLVEILAERELLGDAVHVLGPAAGVGFDADG